MKTNPTNQIKDTMWRFLMDHSQEFNPTNLKESVYDLIGTTTQMDAGQRKNKNYINWDVLDMVMMRIVIEATCFVLSDDFEKIEGDGNG